MKEQLIDHTPRRAREVVLYSSLQAIAHVIKKKAALNSWSECPTSSLGLCVFVRVGSEGTAGQSSVHGVSLLTYQKKLWPQW